MNQSKALGSLQGTYQDISNIHNSVYSTNYSY